MKAKKTKNKSINWKDKLTGNMKSVYFKQGTYSAGLTVLVVIVVITVNLFFGEIPAKYTKIDVSPEQLYSIGTETKEMLSGLVEEVTLYHICESGSEDQTITELLEQYASASKQIKVELKDPVLNPSFTSQYTDTEVASNSIIAVSGERSKVIAYDEIYEYEMDYETYSYSVTGFDGEGQITSGIDYVVSEELPVLYTLEGHGESEIGSSLQALIEKQNIEIESLNLLSSEQVPEDAAALLILAPDTDLTETETAAITEYAENGGSILAVTNYGTDEMPYMDQLLENYNIARAEGVVMEQDANYYYQGYPFYLLPEIGYHEVSSSISSSGKYVLVITAQGIQVIDEDNEDVSVSSLLSTSSQAISKVDLENAETYEPEDGDIEGPFDVGVAVTRTYGTAGDESEEDPVPAVESKLVYFSAESIFDADVDAAVSGTNSELIISALTWMCEQEAVTSIPAKSMSTETLVLSASQIGSIGFAVTLIIPVGILSFGGVIWLRRRKK